MKWSFLLLSYILIVCIIALAAFIHLMLEETGLIFIRTSQKSSDQSAQSVLSIPEITEDINDSNPSLFLVGDIMLDRGVEYMIEKYGGEDWRFPFLEISDDFKKADILFGNLESVISDKGQKVGSIYSFRAKPEAVEGLIYAGFNVLSVANNHIFDYGREAMEDSFQRLKEAGIDFVGGGFSEKEARSGILKEIKGVKIAFLAYTNLGSEKWQAGEDFSGIAWLDERIETDIKKAKENSDLVVVSMHFGEEYQIQPSSEQRYWAHLAIDSGADLVIGHHPHVVQPLEKYTSGDISREGSKYTSGDISREGSKYKNGWIVYSLGNFVFDQGFSEETMKGLLLEVSIKDAKIKEVIPKEVKINNFFQPEIEIQE